MMWIMVTCPHKSVFWDGDESKCRICGDSLSFPRRPPGPADERERRRDRLVASGEKRRRDSAPVEVQEIIQVAQEVEHSSSARLLCNCCLEMLPPENFYASNHQAAKKRNYRAPRCRGCTSFQLRVKRQEDPEGFRERDRARRARYQESLTTEQRQQEKERRGAAQDTAENRAAQTRRRARQDGRKVLKQRSGRQPIYLKPICRVFQTCPLRPYCTVEAKGLG